MEAADNIKHCCGPTLPQHSRYTSSFYYACKVSTIYNLINSIKLQLQSTTYNLDNDIIF